MAHGETQVLLGIGVLRGVREIDALPNKDFATGMVLLMLHNLPFIDRSSAASLSFVCGPTCYCTYAVRDAVSSAGS